MAIRKKPAGAWLGLSIIAVCFMVLAPILGMYRISDFTIFCIYVLGFNLLYGFMGRLSFGHMLYLGTGAYAVTLCAEHITANPFVAIPFSVMAGALIGLLLGPIVVRTTGACHALINLALNQIGYFLILVVFAKYTGGEDGMSAFFSNVGFLDFSNEYIIFAFSLSSLLLTFYILTKLVSSPFGVLIKAIKEDETRVLFLGYNTFVYKLVTFVISTSITALAGGLMILNYGYVTPSFIDPTRNVEVIFATLIGGAGSLYGSLVGGVVYMIMSNYLASYITRWEMFLGLALLIVIFRFKEGIWGYAVDKFSKTIKKQSEV